MSEKNKLRKMREKKKSLCETLAWEKKKLRILRNSASRTAFRNEYNHNTLLRMTSKNFEEIFQLLKDDVTKENTKIRELITPRLELAATTGFLSRAITEELCLWALFFLLNYEQFYIYFFPRFFLLRFTFSNHLSDIFTFYKNF